jgi:hypothetical protein
MNTRKWSDGSEVLSYPISCGGMSPGSADSDEGFSLLFSEIAAGVKESLDGID